MIGEARVPFHPHASSADTDGGKLGVRTLSSHPLMIIYRWDFTGVSNISHPLLGNVGIAMS